MSVADDFEAKRAEADAMRPPNMPTEAVLGAIEMGLNRCWPHNGRPADADGSWVAILGAPPIGEFWSCSHSHKTPTGGWACALTALRIIVEQKADPRHFQWEAVDDG